MLVALRCGFRSDEGFRLAFDIATQGGSQALGLGGYRLNVA